MHHEKILKNKFIIYDLVGIMTDNHCFIGLIHITQGWYLPDLIE